MIPRRPVLLVLALGVGLGSPAAAVDEWGSETNLSGTPTPTETGLNHRALAMTPAGVVHVAWAERDGPDQTYRIWTRRWESGAWGAAARIVDYLASDPGNPGDEIGAKYPSLVAAPNGDVHLFWHDYRIGGIANVEIFWKMLPAGGVWDPSRAADVRLTTSQHPETTGDNGYVPVAVAQTNGDVSVAWYDYRFDGWNAEILTKTRPAGGVWDLTPGDGADVRITDDSFHSELVDVAAEPDGTLHAVWRSGEAGARVRHSRRDPITALWSVPDLVDGAATVAGAPTCAVDEVGTLHVVWPDGRLGGRALWTRECNDTGEWEDEIQLTSPGDGADEPSLTADVDGTLHLVWSDGRINLFQREIYHRERSAGGVWPTTPAEDARISESAVGASSRPSVIARHGTVFVAWRDSRDGNEELYVRRGGPAGTHAPAAARGRARDLVAVPNPTRDAVRLLYPDGEHPRRISVWDVRGRRVRSLTDGVVDWDGRDRDGALVPAGVYFLRDRGHTARVTVRR